MGERRAWYEGLGLALAWLAATIPFAPSIREFLSRGVPDVLFTGDGAVLELGTWRAAHHVQLLGPYSRFGWTHPGPAYFYLAVPFYEALGERGAALNVFALCVDYVAVLGIVFFAYRLRGTAFSLLVAAFISAYVLVGAPFLLANEWNPIVPILPVGLATLIAVCIADGDRVLWPVFAFVASAIVQTHLGFAPVLAALALFAFVMTSGTERVVRRGIWMTTAGVVGLCWLLPALETVMHPPGNLGAIFRFFVPKHWSEHSWFDALRVTGQQMAVMPNAVLQLTRSRPVTAPRLAGIMLAAQVVVLALMATSGKNTASRSLARVALIELAATVLAVRAIRGDIEFYLVAWISVLGVISFAALTAGVLELAERYAGETLTLTAAALLATACIGLSLTLPVARSPVVRAPDVTAESIARETNRYVQDTAIEHPVLRVASMETWPTAAATLLFLAKHGVAVSAGGDLLGIVGNAFAPLPDPHTDLIFGLAAARLPAGAVPVAEAGRLTVYRRN